MDLTVTITTTELTFSNAHLEWGPPAGGTVDYAIAFVGGVVGSPPSILPSDTIRAGWIFVALRGTGAVVPPTTTHDIGVTPDTGWWFAVWADDDVGEVFSEAPPYVLPPELYIVSFSGTEFDTV